MNYIGIKDIEILSYIHSDEIVCGASTRLGGYSKGSYSTLNIGLNTNDNKEAVRANREKLFSAIAPDFSVAYVNQTHSNIIHKVDEDFKNFVDGDGLITTMKHTLLLATIADCGSVCFHNKDNTVVAILHCGWRGTRDNIIENMCAKLSEYDKLSNFIAFMGPMIQVQNYEVGKAFFEYFDEQYISENNKSYFFDLNACIYDKLSACGIGTISNPKIDTFSNENTFYSHRRNNNAGRMCAFIGLK